MTEEKDKSRTFYTSPEVEKKLDKEKKKDYKKSFSQIIRELILGEKE